MRLTLRGACVWMTLLSGCLVSRPEIPKPECEVDSECTAGKICGPAGRCTDACKADSDCPSPATCASGACVLPAGACARSTDCASGEVCANARCETSCTAAADCATDEACVAGACLSLSSGACRYDTDCAAPLACLGGRCSAACVGDRDCSSPATCQQGACALPTGTCAKNADCAMNEVCSVGGKCARACTAASQCAATEACVGGACVTLATGACRFTSECPAPQACVQGRCAEACLADRDCPFGTGCQQSACAPVAPTCLFDADCPPMEACGPQGQCVKACTASSQCAATGEACSNGACVRVGVDTAGLTGSVRLPGVTDASNLAVSVDGPNRDSSLTQADGGFAFLGLVPGLYRVTVTAPGTLEGSATREVAARAGVTTTIPPITLTAAGDVTGTVTLAGRTSHEGIQVVALGTGKGTVTAPDGRFTLRQLPVGTVTILAASTGYQSAQVPNVAVQYGQAANLSALALQPLPSGSTFSFSSVPPTTATYGQPWTYQAVAGGGGVSSVTYSLVDFPPGMTIDANTGQVTWNAIGNGFEWVVIAATGGGATVYQLFYVEVLSSAALVFAGATDRLVRVDGGVWVLGTDVRFVDDDGGVRLTFPAQGEVRGTIGTLEHLNGRKATAVSTPGGGITGASGAFGTLQATWEGGVIAGVSAADTRVVQSSTLLGGTTTSAVVPTRDTITTVGWQRGSITSLDDGRATATGFSAQTGIIGTVTATGFDDSSAAWTPGVFDPLCVMNAAGTVRIGITSHTATTFVLDSDPRALLAPGQRYFVGACSGAFTTTYTFVDANRTATPAATGRSIDVYTSFGTSVGFWPLAATTQPPNSTLSFVAPISSYAALASAATTGFYAVGSTSNGHDVLVTDTSAPWTASTSADSRFTFEDFSATLVIAASTTTTLTVRMALGTLARNRPGRGWVLTDAGSNVQVTLGLATGGLGAVSGEWLWLDALGRGYQIVGNTAATVTLDVPRADFPLPSLVSTVVGRSVGSGLLPRVRVTSSGLTPGSLAARVPVRLTNGGTPLVHDPALVVAANDATGFDLPETSCSPVASCLGALAARQAAFTNATWAPGLVATPVRVELRLQFSGAPNFSIDALRGRSVALESSPSTSALVASNDASSVVLEVPEPSLQAFRSLGAGDRVWFSDPTLGTTTPMRVQLTAQGASWTVNEWAGATLVVGNTLAGVVSSNTATQLELALSNASTLSLLQPGVPFAFARPHAQGVGCGTTGLWIRSQLSLAGAQLVANAYTHVRSEVVAHRFPLASNTASGAELYLCATNFGDLVGIVNRAAVFDTNGRFDLVLHDASASMTPNQYAGQYLYLNGTSGGRFRAAISSHTATSFTMQHDSADWFGSSPWRRVTPGARYLVTNANQELPVTLTVSPPLVAGELVGKVVRLSDASTAGTSLDVSVIANTANTITLGDISVANLSAIERSGESGLRIVSFSRGSALRITDPFATFTPGALVGRVLSFGTSTRGLVVENDATSFVAYSADQEFAGEVSDLSGYTILASSWADDVATRPTGELVATRLDGRLAEYSRDGTTRWITPLTTGRWLTVQSQPTLLQGTFTANAVSGGTYAISWSNPSWTFTPGELVNGTVRVKCGSTTWSRRLVRANTRTSITAWGTEPCPSSQRFFAVETGRLAVTGATLVAGELKGAWVWINGEGYEIRDNTANELQVVLPDAMNTNGNALDLAFRGTRALVTRGHLPQTVLSALSVEGTQGYLLATDADFFSRFDGTSWSRVPLASTGNRLRTGTVTAVLDGFTLIDANATYAVGELIGKHVVVGGWDLPIVSNTRTGIAVSTNWVLDVPVPGTTYAIYGENRATTVQTMLPTGGVTHWLGAANGLFRFDGTNWTQHTVASTATSPGASDGLRSDDVERLTLARNGDLFVSDLVTGVSRLRGSAWRQFRLLNTESAPGRQDGLQSDRIYDVEVAPNGTIYFATHAGLSRFDGTTWKTYGLLDGISGVIDGVWLTPQGRLHVTNGLGLFRLEP